MYFILTSKSIKRREKKKDLKKDEYCFLYFQTLLEKLGPNESASDDDRPKRKPTIKRLFSWINGPGAHAAGKEFDQKCESPMLELKGIEDETPMLEFKGFENDATIVACQQQDLGGECELGRVSGNDQKRVSFRETFS